MRGIFYLLASVLSLSAFGYEFGSDVPESIRTQITDDLKFMKTIESTDQSDLHKQIFQKVDGPTYVEWFESRVTHIGLNSCGGGNAVACVIPFLGSSKIWLTKNYTNFSHPTIAKMMIVYHEARHTEVNNGNWPHATCPTPFVDPQGKEKVSIWTGAKLAGEPACDETPFGSYGSSMILLKNVSKFCTSCSDKVKQDAGLYADDQFGRIIDEDAIKQIKKDLYDGVAIRE